MRRKKKNTYIVSYLRVFHRDFSWVLLDNLHSFSNFKLKLKFDYKLLKSQLHSLPKPKPNLDFTQTFHQIWSFTKSFTAALWWCLSPEVPRRCRRLNSSKDTSQEVGCARRHLQQIPDLNLICCSSGGVERQRTVKG